MEKPSFHMALASVQAELKAPKDMDNKFGGYKYRNAESILAAVKPLLAKVGLSINLTDEIVVIGDRYYLRARASVTDGATVQESTAFAREPLTKKGMDDSQVTGSASSYARKYALCGLFGIDDSSADPDAPENHPDNPATQKREARIRAAAQKGAEDRAKDEEQVKAEEAAIVAELEAVTDLPALAAYYKAHEAACKNHVPVFSARKKAIVADIRAKVAACSTVADLETLQNATPGAQNADVSAIFAERFRAIQGAADVEAAL